MRANDKCPCGSGEKYKDCCMEDDDLDRQRMEKRNSRASRFRPKEEPPPEPRDNDRR